MKIAQVAPLRERVPPPTYGGIELVVSRLTDELVRRGHEVTLFASGDSQTLAKLEAIYPRALRLDPNVNDYDLYEMLELSQVCQRAGEFDLIHSHIGMMALPMAGLISTPTVHTLHGSFTPDTTTACSYHKQQPYVSISNAQRMVDLNYVGTVYNGIDIGDYHFYPEASEQPYLAFLGRFSPEKGPHHAIAIAKKTGCNLKMAGKIDEVDVKFFESEVAPHIDGKQIEFFGEVSNAEKAELMGKASATLFPITWREPFGLVMIESMASGTPVIGMNLGSVPEVIDHGVTGFVCQSYDEMAQMVSKTLELSRHDCRKYVENTFSVSQMVDGYEEVYRKLVKQRLQSNGHLHAAKIRY
ncbi:MAG: glycosyltransferase family 4 protein [Cyanobacteria bacterium P01_A01_bin.84]